ncbi:hypothetical protein BZZ01_28100 [Nostocales cyanobacterium HT-58-2]|nr:hypothetical protein BZZ01_28100 [Nostocales cyanobacterium HT-58-2]
MNAKSSTLEVCAFRTRAKCSQNKIEFGEKLLVDANVQVNVQVIDSHLWMLRSRAYKVATRYDYGFMAKMFGYLGL